MPLQCNVTKCWKAATSWHLIGFFQLVYVSRGHEETSLKLQMWSQYYYVLLGQGDIKWNCWIFACPCVCTLSCLYFRSFSAFFKALFTQGTSIERACYFCSIALRHIHTVQHIHIWDCVLLGFSSPLKGNSTGDAEGERGAFVIHFVHPHLTSPARELQRKKCHSLSPKCFHRNQKHKQDYRGQNRAG